MSIPSCVASGKPGAVHTYTTNRYVNYILGSLKKLI